MVKKAMLALVFLVAAGAAFGQTVHILRVNGEEEEFGQALEYVTVHTPVAVDENQDKIEWEFHPPTEFWGQGQVDVLFKYQMVDEETDEVISETVVPYTITAPMALGGTCPTGDSCAGANEAQCLQDGCTKIIGPCTIGPSKFCLTYYGTCMWWPWIETSPCLCQLVGGSCYTQGDTTVIYTPRCIGTTGIRCVSNMTVAPYQI